MHTDRAYHVVAAGRTLFFGNNVDNHIYALDTRTAEERGRFAADGSVRFAPVLHEGSLFFGSDDGNVYCLNAADGSLVWKYRPSPSGEQVIGNGRMLSLWPVRTGLLLEVWGNRRSGSAVNVYGPALSVVGGCPCGWHSSTSPAIHTAKTRCVFRVTGTDSDHAGLTF